MPFYKCTTRSYLKQKIRFRLAHTAEKALNREHYPILVFTDGVYAPDVKRNTFTVRDLGIILVVTSLYPHESEEIDRIMFKD